MEEVVCDCVIKAELEIITCGADEQRPCRPLAFIVFIFSCDFANLIFFLPNIFLKKQTEKNPSSSKSLQPTIAPNVRTHTQQKRVRKDTITSGSPATPNSETGEERVCHAAREQEQDIGNFYCARTAARTNPKHMLSSAACRAKTQTSGFGYATQLQVMYMLQRKLTHWPPQQLPKLPHQFCSKYRAPRYSASSSWQPFT